jgi:hypothetical protein
VEWVVHNRLLRVFGWLGGEDGLILPLVLAVFVVGILLIAPTLGHNYTSLEATTVAEAKAQELHAADAGIERGFLAVRNGSLQGSDFQINECDVEFTIEDTANLNQGLFPIYRITSVASVAEGSQTTIYAHVSRMPYPTFPAQYINPGGNIAGNVVITGDFVLNGEDYSKITGNVTIGGTLVIFGDLIMQGSSLTVENIIVFGNVEMQGDSDISGNLCATGSISLSGSASITGVVTTGCSMDIFDYGILNYEVV